MVVDLFSATFAQKRPIDGLGVVVGDLGGFARTGYRVRLLVDQSNELLAHLVCYLQILTYHSTCLLQADICLYNLILTNYSSRIGLS